MNDAAPTIARTMTAWRQHRYAGPEAVAAESVDVPTPARGEVLVRIRATGLNAADRHVMRGDPLLLRAAFGLRRPRIATRGMDVAGRVVALGDDVTSLAIGDEVMGELPGGGGLAQYAVSPATRLVARPPEVAPVSAAAIPLAGGTAWQALALGGIGGVDGVGGVDDKTAAARRVLVIGASGGVGTFAVQLAAHRGAEVWALCGAHSRELVEALGAQRTFDYRETDAADLSAGGFDVVLDIACTAPLRALKKLLRPGGTVVMVGGEGGRVLGPVGRMLRAVFVSLGGDGRRIRPLAAVAKTGVTTQLAALAAAGSIRPVIERTFRFDEARAALAHVDAGRTVGKVVVEVG